ncbi:MAG: CPBP family glutamic-type intramembrane protease [Intrasporangium sp.]|uniref:CPBP family glutamic-type intramembrane protease n=1 Tax=Intrasporangium sp. TaxID=1925024 RepID=UPI002648E8FF|nr:CPBP family glutamic-type intramembrane protease [Intrasporangium sp.]MDN5796177.1 CPBP family glutamic-type intramembrane protease [Intrasporangium sp.]
MISPVWEVRRFLHAALVQPVPTEARESDPREVRRRRIVAAVTIAAGGAVLAVTLRLEAGSPLFLPLGFALGALWTGGAFASGPLHLGSGHTRAGGRSRPIVQSLALAVLLLAVFLAGAVLVARMPLLRNPVLALLEHGRAGPLPVVLALTTTSGVAEELFFRGALQTALPANHAIAGTTTLYALTTLGSGVPLLVLAALVLGLVTALQRRVTGGVLGPAITHVTWSTGMLLLLAPALNLAR